MTVKIYYLDKDRKINQELDNDLEKILLKHGLKRWASGIDMTTGERDLAFEEIRKE
jgi:hypothetical protein